MILRVSSLQSTKKLLRTFSARVQIVVDTLMDETVEAVLLTDGCDMLPSPNPSMPEDEDSDESSSRSIIPSIMNNAEINQPQLIGCRGQFVFVV